jgi:hypothetical protein
VFEVRDLWPEAPIQMGALRNPLARRLARALERFVYARSTRLIALSPGIRAALPPRTGRARAERRRPRPVRPDPPRSPFRWPTSARWARRTTSPPWSRRRALVPDVRFVLMGDGKRRPELERAAPPNVQLPTRRKTDVAAARRRVERLPHALQGRARAGHQLAEQAFDTFAAGRAAIVNMDGWMRELVEGKRGGRLRARRRRRELAEKVGLDARQPGEVRGWARTRGALAEREFGARRARRAGRSRCSRRPARLTELSYCVVNTERARVPARLPRRDRAAAPGGRRVRGCSCLDNALRGRVGRRGARAPSRRRGLFALEAPDRQGGQRLAPLREARGRCCLLLNEDSELRDGAARAPARRARARSGAAIAGAQL